MKKLFQKGDIKVHNFTVHDENLAQFGSEVVHPVCSTFTLAREIEWSSRLFVIEMLEEDEEGVGTYLQIDHHSPAVKGEELVIKATVIEIKDHELRCGIEVNVGDRLIASGETGQKILKSTKIASLLDGLGNG